MAKWENRKDDFLNTEGLRLLSELFVEVGRYGPALKVVRRLLAADPKDVEAKRKMDRLLRCW